MAHLSMVRTGWQTNRAVKPSFSAQTVGRYSRTLNPIELARFPAKVLPQIPDFLRLREHEAEREESERACGSGELEDEGRVC